jgi:hypothetical protein
MAPLTLITGFFGMNVPIPGPSMNPDEHERCACWLCLWPARPLVLTSQLLIHTLREIQSDNRSVCDFIFVTKPFLAATLFGFGAFSRTFLFFLLVHLSVFAITKCEMLQTANVDACRGCVACVLFMWIGFKYLRIWK